MKKFNRRRFLIGAGGATLALPLLEKLAPHAYAQVGGPHPKRIICLSYGMGTAMQHWMPTAAGFDFDFPDQAILEPLRGLRDRCLFVSNIDLAITGFSSLTSHGHPAAKEATLTGTLPYNSFGGDRSNHVDNAMTDGPEGSEEGAANGESVETFIGRALEAQHGDYTRPSIDLAVDGESNRARELANSNFFHAAPNTPVGLIGDPSMALANTFRDVTPTGEMPDPAIRARRLRQQSSLDAVRESFVELRSGLPNHDRVVLDNHAERIRQIELDVTRMACSIPPGSSVSMGSMAQTSPIHLATMANAMGCNLAPVGRIQFINQHNPDFGVPEVDNFRTTAGVESSQGWHAMVHRDVMERTGLRTGPTRDNPDDPYEPALLAGYRFFVQQMADLMTMMSEIPEGGDGGSVLDNTLVLLCSEYGVGIGHSGRKQAWTIGGNLGTAHTGYHFDASQPDRPFTSDSDGGHFYSDSAYNTNQLLTSIIKMCGVTNDDGSEIQEFGLRGFTSGVLPIFS